MYLRIGKRASAISYLPILIDHVIISFVGYETEPSPSLNPHLPLSESLSPLEKESKNGNDPAQIRCDHGYDEAASLHRRR